MNTITQQKSYYEKYWTEGRAGYSGDTQGYAANFRDWMRAELEGLSHNSEVLEVGCGDASFTKNLAEFAPRVG